MLIRFQTKGTGAYCYQEKVTGVILFSREGNWCSTGFRRRKLVLYCFHEKVSGALLSSGERNWCTTVLKEKETGALLFKG